MDILDTLSKLDLEDKNDEEFQDIIGDMELGRLNTTNMMKSTNFH